jgi:hypothetical protein
MVIETLCAFPHNSATNEAFERTQRPMILGCNETNRIAHRVRPASAANAVHVILGMHREIVIHHMRNPVHIDAACGDVGRDEHAHNAGLEILQGAQPLIL